MGTAAAARPTWQRYGGALVVTLLAVLGRLALDPVLGRHHDRHLVFLPTVMLSAWFGGFRPGLLSAVLSTLAIDYFWTGAEHGFFHSDNYARDGFELLVFFLASLALCRLMASLEDARSRAAAETKARERILAIVAHDLRNPLTTIKMAVAVLERIPLNDAVDRQLASVGRAASRMESLIRDLIDATRIESGELTLSLSDHDAGPLVDEIAEECAPLARTKGIAVERKIESAIILCDRARVLQTLANLLSNALAFTPEGGHVTISVESDGDVVRFSVADTGPGIRAEHLPHIFERNWTAGSNGLGLGLFIADNIVRAHGGRLWAESEPGRGATFLFTLRRTRPSRSSLSVSSGE